ncbi:MAG: NAD-dependent epimerase/dehydratase family protein [Planctomycetes bacterium]|nr:NAD-dependent epimerase/dehydratase family protein [Planctomycetota bacterium]
MILVTGGAGFIGSHLVADLVASGQAARVFDDLSSGKRENLAGLRGVELVEASLVDAAALERACAGVTTIYHLAACPSVPKSFDEPAFCHAVNATGTLHVAMAAARAKVRRVVFASSCAIYGNTGDVAVAETRPPQPKSPYAAQKLLGEHYLNDYGAAHGFTTVSLRFFNVFGPRQDPSSPYSGVISIFCERLLRGEAITIHGDGRQTRDFVAVADVVQALRLAAKEPGVVHGSVWNVATGRSRTLLELHAALAALVGGAPPPCHGPARAGDIVRSAADITAIQTNLGYRPRVGFTDALASTLDWYRMRAAAVAQAVDKRGATPRSGGKA